MVCNLYGDLDCFSFLPKVSFLQITKKYISIYLFNYEIFIFDIVSVAISDTCIILMRCVVHKTNYLMFTQSSYTI